MSFLSNASIEISVQTRSYRPHAWVKIFGFLVKVPTLGLTVYTNQPSVKELLTAAAWLCLPSFIFFIELQLLLKLWKKKRSSKHVLFFLLCFSLLLPSYPPIPALSSPLASLLRSPPGLPCHSPIALRPLFCISCRLQLCTSFLCSLLVRYRYRFSLSVTLNALFPFSCRRLLSMPAVAQCIRIIAGICAVTSAISPPAAPFHLFHSCVHIRVIQCGELGLFVLVTHAFFRIWVCVCVCICARLRKVCGTYAATLGVCLLVCVRPSK